MPVEGDLIDVNECIMAINPHRTMIVRERIGENLPVQLPLPLHELVQLDYPPHS